MEYTSLAQRLKKDGQVLEYADSARSSTQSRAATSIRGTVIDDQSAQFQGNWSTSTSIRPYIENGYRHDANTKKGQRSVTFSAKLKPGTYDVRLAYTHNANRASNVPVVLYHAHGKETHLINQQTPPPIDNLFLSLGVYDFDGVGVLEMTNTGTDGYVIADAVVFIPKPKEP